MAEHATLFMTLSQVFRYDHWSSTDGHVQCRSRDPSIFLGTYLRYPSPLLICPPADFRPNLFFILLVGKGGNASCTIAPERRAASGSTHVPHFEQSPLFIYYIYKVPPRNMLISRIKCGPYWNNIPGHAERAFCSFCKKTTGDDIMETEQHLWLSCDHNRQRQTWETTMNIWRKTTQRDWPALSLGLIRGSAAITFNDDRNSDSERLRILISMTLWAIWKSRNKNTINNQDVVPNETKEILKEMISSLIRNSWLATKFMDLTKRTIRQNKLRSLWGDGSFVDFIVLSKNNVHVAFFFSMVRGNEVGGHELYSIQVGLSTLPSPPVELSYIIRIRPNVSTMHPISHAESRRTCPGGHWIFEWLIHVIASSGTPQPWRWVLFEGRYINILLATSVAWWVPAQFQRFYTFVWMLHH